MKPLRSTTLAASVALLALAALLTTPVASANVYYCVAAGGHRAEGNQTAPGEDLQIYYACEYGKYTEILLADGALPGHIGYSSGLGALVTSDAGAVQEIDAIPGLAPITPSDGPTG